MAGANAEVLPTSAVLTCASKHINTACAEQTRAFTDCKTAGKDPRECIAQGKALTGCALATYVCEASLRGDGEVGEVGNRSLEKRCCEKLHRMLIRYHIIIKGR